MNQSILSHLNSPADPAHNPTDTLAHRIPHPATDYPIENPALASQKSHELELDGSFNRLTPRVILLSILGFFLFGSTQAGTTLNAQNLVFSFHNSSGLLEAGTHFDTHDSAQPYSLESTVGSVELTMEAVLDGLSENANLNGGADGFGINSQGSNDQTQRIDNGNGQESIEFSFNTAGILQSIDLRYIEESANEAILSFTGGNTFHLNTSTALSGQDDFAINEAFTAGQTIILSISSDALANENFSLEAIHIQIPENNQAVFGMGAGIFLIVFLRSLRH